MSKINLLDASVYNMISAGEVVERPASVVKELIENSIDAGAAEITVLIEDGGLGAITVVDDGAGMDEEDLRRAFLPHATSKLACARDLETVSTLGFRGEALASIAAVARIRAVSCTAQSKEGHYICLEGGTVTEAGVASSPVGTRIEARNLFFNAPVRAKFLKKNKQEEAYVAAVVKDAILANPDIRFRYECDGKEVFLAAGGAEEALCAVYKREVSDQLLPFDYTFDDYRVYGYVGKRTFSKHNRSFQTTVVNGRTVVNAQIQAAVAQAYGEALMKRTYPVFILNLILPFDKVDVNVHPNKNEVRFADERRVFSCVYRAVCLALETENAYLRLNPAPPSAVRQTTAAPIGPVRSVPTFGTEQKGGLPSFNADARERAAQAQTIGKEVSAEQKYDVEALIRRQQQRLDAQRVPETQPVPAPRRKTVGDAQTSLFAPAYREEDSALLSAAAAVLEEPYRVVGQLFDTYLVLECGGQAYLIDQHACHERFLYDELCDCMNRAQIGRQMLLLPYLLECDARQFEFVGEILGDLRAMGFDIEEFGDTTYKVGGVPDVLGEINLKSFFDGLLSEQRLFKGAKTADMLRDTLATRACKAAVKAGDKLSEGQIRAILDEMKKGVPMQCPHGRPAVIAFTRRDLDKAFKRIV